MLAKGSWDTGRLACSSVARKVRPFWGPFDSETQNTQIEEFLAIEFRDEKAALFVHVVIDKKSFALFSLCSTFQLTVFLSEISSFYLAVEAAGWWN